MAQQGVEVRDPGVVAALRQRRNGGAARVDRPHAGDLEQRRVGAGERQGVEPGSQPPAEETVVLGRSELDHSVAVADVEHVPRAQHDKRDIGAAGSVGPAARPSRGRCRSRCGTPRRAVTISPDSCTLQPLIGAVRELEVVVDPHGRLTNNECACESPTIATERGSTGNVVVVVDVVVEA